MRIRSKGVAIARRNLPKIRKNPGIKFCARHDIRADSMRWSCHNLAAEGRFVDVGEALIEALFDHTIGAVGAADSHVQATGLE